MTAVLIVGLVVIALGCWGLWAAMTDDTRDKIRGLDPESEEFAILTEQTR